MYWIVGAILVLIIGLYADYILSRNSKRKTFLRKLANCLMSTEDIESRTAAELKIISLLGVIKEGKCTIDREPSPNFKSHPVYYNDYVIVTISGGNKNEHIKINTNSNSKEVVWLYGSVKFIFDDGREFILSQKNNYILIKPNTKYIAKSLENDTLCVTILKPEQ